MRPRFSSPRPRLQAGGDMGIRYPIHDAGTDLFAQNRLLLCRFAFFTSYG
jgi:hypothetical protein